MMPGLSTAYGDYQPLLYLLDYVSNAIDPGPTAAMAATKPTATTAARTTTSEKSSNPSALPISYPT
jgi:hypothetical protein